MTSQQCPAMQNGQQCMLTAGHTEQHQLPAADPGWSSSPAPVPSTPVPPAPVRPAGPPPSSHRWRNIGIGVVVVFIALAALGSLVKPAGTGSPSGSPNGTSGPNASIADTAAPPDTPSPTSAAPATLLDQKGSGIGRSKKFTTAGDWEIDWSYDCAKFGFNGNFIVTVAGDTSDVAVNELGKKGSGTVPEYTGGGTFYLEMNSECNWHVIVKG